MKNLKTQPLKSLRWLLLLFFFFLLIILSGKILDQEAERVVNQLYIRDQNGVIKGLEPYPSVKHYSQALLLLHGFQSSPDTWNELIQDIAPKIKADIYNPLLPFHGKDLKTLSHFDMNILKKSLQQTIEKLSKEYQLVTIVGFSLSGALMAELAYEKVLPKNTRIVLYNPSLFLKDNTLFRRLQMHAYLVWRQYCNYPSLGCTFPHYESGDHSTKAKIEEQKNLQYDVVPAALQVYHLDLKSRDILAQIPTPFDLIISKDDNYLNYVDQEKACETNASCHLISFDAGKHIIHWGEQKVKFENLILDKIKPA